MAPSRQWMPMDLDAHGHSIEIQKINLKSHRKFEPQLPKGLGPYRNKWNHCHLRLLDIYSILKVGISRTFGYWAGGIPN